MRLEEHPDHLPAELQRAVGSKTGIVKKIQCSLPERNDPIGYLTTPETSDVSSHLGIADELELRAVGKGANLPDSMSSAVGEVLERYAYSDPDRDELIRASYAEFTEAANTVDFRFLDIFDADFRERHLAELTRETELLWAEGTNLLTGEEVLVPAQLVWNRVGPLEDRPKHFIGTSNGLAAGPTLREALLWGAYEVVERDGIMRTWWRRRSPPSLEINEMPWLRQFVERHYPNDFLTVGLHECNSKVNVPIYACTLVNERDQYPNFLICGAAGLNTGAVLKEAVIEASQGWPWLVSNRHEYGEIDIDNVVADLDRNVVYYSRPENFEDVSFLFEGQMVRPTIDPETTANKRSAETELATLLARFDEADCTPIAFDLTTDDVRQCGVRVVRMFVPEFVGLKTPAAVPRRHPAFEGEDLTGHPHPFP